MVSSTPLIVREARNKGRAKFKLNQKKAQTKECSKQVTVNGDIFHQMASEREIPNATLETIPEEQTPHVSAVEHPQDTSYKMFFSKRTKPRKKKALHVPVVKLPQGPFELSDDWQLQFDLAQQDGDAKQECNPNQPLPPPHALQIPRWVFPGINGSVNGSRSGQCVLLIQGNSKL